MTERATICIELTKEQQEKLQQATGKEVTRLKLEALEARVAPGKLFN